ncbi:MAG: hypothetical protein K9N47_22410 [Prosthecobacter sp.]|uniref:hypothetical protein n=1 Tax=Prosthecobacter sp. TaxID=1965333 RepID=UPI00260E3961|nr:hypothetical protein [Prosthecobacter sp.]MCF7788895.1 hypothetical protein [Prosthecobacter sp.]
MSQVVSQADRREQIRGYWQRTESNSVCYNHLKFQSQISIWRKAHATAMLPGMKNNHVELLVEPTDLTSNISLFRYMQLSTLLLLLEGRAFFPSVANLNKGDPFEGNLFCEPARLIRQFDTAKRDHKLQKWLLKRAKDWERKQLQSLNGDARLNSKIRADIYTRELKQRRAAWCWFNWFFGDCRVIRGRV